MRLSFAACRLQNRLELLVIIVWEIFLSLSFTQLHVSIKSVAIVGFVTTHITFLVFWRVSGFIVAIQTSLCACGELTELALNVFSIGSLFSMASFHVLFQIALVKSGIITLVTLVGLHPFMNSSDMLAEVT